jgi:hypothetical protein
MPRRRRAEWSYSSIVLNLGSRWKWMISFTPLPNCSRGNSPWYPLDRWLGGTESQSGLYGGDKNLLPLRESNPESSAVQPVTWSLYRLSYPFIYYLFICGLFAGAVGSSEYVASSGGMIKERWTVRDLEGSLKMRKTTRSLDQLRRYRSRDSNRASPEDKPETLPP